MDNKHMKRCSAPFAVRKMQIRAPGDPTGHQGGYTKKGQMITRAVTMWRRGNPQPLLAGTE